MPIRKRHPQLVQLDSAVARITASASDDKALARGAVRAGDRVAQIRCLDDLDVALDVLFIDAIAVIRLVVERDVYLELGELV